MTPHPRVAVILLLLGLTTCKPSPAKPEVPPACTDTRSDEANCGECGHACADGQTCTEGLCTSPCPGEMTFAAPHGSPIAIGAPTFRVGAAVDFNGDGKIDFASSLGVVLGLGHGQFQVVNQASHSVTIGTQAGDFTGDGRLDVLLHHPNYNELIVIPGKGDGTFGFGLRPQYVALTEYAVGDVDSDGISDVVSVNGPPGELRLLRGQVTGTLASPAPLDSPIHAYRVGLADVTGDGRTDLVLANDTQLAVMPNAGGGTFGTAQLYPLTFSALAITFGDADGDGVKDIFASGPLGLTVLRGFGSGTVQVSEVPGPRGEMLAADLNGDHKADLVNTGAGVINIELGRGDGTFEPPRSYRYLERYSRAVWVGDLTEDSIPDIVLSDEVRSLYVLPGLGDGTFDAEPALPAGGGPIESGDFNGDGRPDVAVFDSSWSTLALMLAKPDTGFLPPVFYRTSPGALKFAGDFNEDGRTDVLVFGGSQLEVRLADAAGTLGDGLPIDTGSFKALTVAHFDSDRHLDLAIFDRTKSEIRVLAGQGDGRFMLASTTPVVLGQNTSITVELSTGDLNGDGKTDLILANGGESVLLGNGDGTLQAERTVLPSRYRFYSVTAADMDGDGKQDLIEAPSGEGYFEQEVLLRRGHGDGTFDEQTQVQRGLPGRAITRDLDGNGRADFFHRGDLWLLNKDGTFKSVPGIDTFDAAFADFDGDGRLDAAVSLPPGGGSQIRYHFMEPTQAGVTAGLQPPRASLNPITTRADFNGDGVLDQVSSDDVNNILLSFGDGAGGFSLPIAYPLRRNYVTQLQIADYNSDGRPDVAVTEFDTVHILYGTCHPRP